MHDPRDHAGPSGLMTGAEAGAVVAVKVLVEENQIAPVRILLEHARAAKHRTTAVGAAEKNVSQTPGDIFGHLIKVHAPARPGGALDQEFVAVVGVVLQKRADDQTIDRHPD